MRTKGHKAEQIVNILREAAPTRLTTKTVSWPYKAPAGGQQ
jgi:hypothetical protein